MSVKETAKSGVVRERANLRILDTREMAWETFPGHPAGKIKVLRRNEDGSSGTHLMYLEGPRVVYEGRKPFKHIHKTIREYAYFIEGLFPLLEYETDEEQERAFPVGIKAGYFLDRQPKSWHGVNTNDPPPTHIISFEFRDKAGNFISEPEAEEENVHVVANTELLPRDERVVSGLPVSWQSGTGTIAGTVYNRGGATWLDTREMVWEELPSGGKIKPLARFMNGHPSEGHVEVFQLWQPADSSIRELPYRYYAKTIREEFLVLSGEMLTWEYEDAEQREGDLVALKPGFYVERKPESIHGVEPSISVEVDSLILVRRTGAGTLIGEPGYDEEIVHVPYS
jgi:hypothetical protein